MTLVALIVALAMAGSYVAAHADPQSGAAHAAEQMRTCIASHAYGCER